MKIQNINNTSYYQVTNKNFSGLSQIEVLGLLGANLREMSGQYLNGRSFQDSNFGVYSSSGMLGMGVKMTSLARIQPDLLAYVVDFEHKINNGRKKPVELIITGGSEKGHAQGRYSHENGWKLDFRKDPEIKKWFESNNWPKTYRVNHGAQEVGYQEIGSKFVWWEERTHWDVGFKP